jgi:hypothetical protein
MSTSHTFPPITDEELCREFGCIPISNQGVINFLQPYIGMYISRTDTVTHEHMYLSRLLPDSFITVVGDQASASNVLRFQAGGAKVIHIDHLYEFLHPEENNPLSALA